MTGSERVKEILGKTHNFAALNSAANIETLSYLSNLSDFLQDQEQQFYDALGVNDIQGLNQMLKQIDISYNFNALSAGGSIYHYINENYTFKDKSKDNTNEIVGENVFDLFTELLSNTDAQKFIDYYFNERDVDAIYNGAMDALSEIFQGVTIDGGFIKYIFSARGTRSKTKRYAKNKEELANVSVKVITLNEAILKQQGEIKVINNRFVITGNPAKFTSTVNKEIKEYIQPELMRRLNKTYGFKTNLGIMSEAELRNTVNNIITQNFGIQLDALDLESASHIAINGSAGGISGYLGELQSHLYFKALFKNVKNASIIDAGASYIKSMSGATQMDPADTIIQIANQLFNIQVKNYASGGAEWGGGTDIFVNAEKVRGTSGAASFLSDRLQVNIPYLSEFFGAATWHNLNPAYSDDPSYATYEDTYGEFQAIFGALKESFDTFIPNIIRLTAIINGSDLQYENFYFSKGRMIPASSLVNGIIEALYGSPSKKCFTSSYSMHPGASHYTYEHPYTGSYASFANETSIAWRISVNFNTILKSLGG